MKSKSAYGRFRSAPTLVFMSKVQNDLPLQIPSESRVVLTSTLNLLFFFSLPRNSSEDTEEFMKVVSPPFTG